MELVINTFGTSLNRDNEGFVISTAEGRQRVPAEGISSIQISKGAQITSELRFTSFSLGNRKTGFFKEMVDFRTFLDNEAAVDPQCLAGNE